MLRTKRTKLVFNQNLSLLQLITSSVVKSCIGIHCFQTYDLFFHNEMLATLLTATCSIQI